MKTTSPQLFKDVSQDASFWNQYFFDSDSIVLVGFSVLLFLVLQIIFIYWHAKKKTVWALMFSNIAVALFTWATTLYFLYPDLILGLIF